MKLTVATAQFPVRADSRSNARHILRQMRIAKGRGAHVIHFCEGALSGYPGVDFPSFECFDWQQLERCEEQVRDLAGRIGLWVILGTAHRTAESGAPHHRTLAISEGGEVVAHYDRAFRSGGAAAGSSTEPLTYASNGLCRFVIRGVPCGVLSGEDYHFPERYRTLARRGVQLVLHGCYEGNLTAERLRRMQARIDPDLHHLNRGTTLPEITVAASLQAAAATNHLWISCSNTSARESCWPSFFVRPDGVMIGRLRRNTAGLLITTVGVDDPLLETAPAAYRFAPARGRRSATQEDRAASYTRS